MVSTFQVDLPNALTDQVYPFDQINFAIWAASCSDQFTFRLLESYYSMNSLLSTKIFNQTVCTNYMNALNAINSQFCSQNCSNAQFFYAQFSNGTISNSVFLSSSILMINTTFFTPALNMTIEYSNLFQNQSVDFSTKQYSYLFNPNLSPDRPLKHKVT